MVLVLEAELLIHIDLLVPNPTAELVEVTDVEVEQLPEPETEPEVEMPPLEELETLQVLAFAICVGCDITPGTRSMVKRANTAPIENANLCI